MVLPLSNKIISTQHYIPGCSYIEYRGWLYKIQIIGYSQLHPKENVIYQYTPIYTVVAEEITNKFGTLTWQARSMEDAWFSRSILRNAIEARHSKYKDCYK